MRLVTFRDETEERLGFLLDDHVAVGRLAGVIGHAFRIDDVTIQQKP